MSNDTQTIEHRISSALSRLSAALDALSRTEGQAPATGPDPAPQLVAAQEALAAQTAKVEELTRFLSEAREQHRAELAALQSQLDQSRTEIDAQGLELQRLRSTNVQLRESQRAQTEAVEAGDDDGQQAQAALQAELEALRASRQAEIAELNQILADLDPLIEATRPAQENRDA